MSASRWILTAATAALLSLAITGCSSSPTVKAQSLKAVDKRKTAPDFELKGPDGRTVRLSDYKGKVVVLDFWATWCGPCKIEIPWFIDFERKHKDQGFAVLGVAMDDDGWSAVKPFMSELGINYPIVIGNDRTADAYGGIEALPTTFIIDREGKVASTHVGLAAKRDFEDAIEKLLQKSGGDEHISVAAAPVGQRSN